MNKQDHVQEPATTDSPGTDPVAPVESAASAPLHDDRPERLSKCWNCGAVLDAKGVCAKCGFELDKLHNMFLETDKQRYQDEQAARNL